jgi:SAM-dependent methyltransferase
LIILTVPPPAARLLRSSTNMHAAANDPNQDVPSPIDLRDPSDAHEWVASADRKRPWRVQIRTAIAELVRATSPAPRRVLELGAGPGFLADALLQVCSVDNYTLFDFSQPMLDMARARLANRPSATFICGDFKLPDWTEPFAAPFDVVLAMQAVHEIRHKGHLPGLYRQIFGLLRPGGLMIVCDHTPPDDSARSTALHSTEAEQHAALGAGGFVDVGTHLVLNGLYVCTAWRQKDAGS